MFKVLYSKIAQYFGILCVKKASVKVVVEAIRRDGSEWAKVWAGNLKDRFVKDQMIRTSKLVSV